MSMACAGNLLARWAKSRIHAGVGDDVIRCLHEGRAAMLAAIVSGLILGAGSDTEQVE
jgi:hypothetical protein